MKPYKRIAPTFEMLLSEEARAGLHEAVEAEDVDWYTTVTRIFELGLAEWRRRRLNAEQEADDGTD
jgi:hypothetical protein